MLIFHFTFFTYLSVYNLPITVNEQTDAKIEKLFQIISSPTLSKLVEDILKIFFADKKTF